MNTATTARPINLAQLGRELGTTELSAATSGTTTTVTCHAATITAAQLSAAVNAHVAVDEQANATTLRERADTAMANNRTYLAVASPTTAQNTAQIKALTRQNTALIRLVLNKLDGLD